MHLETLRQLRSDLPVSVTVLIEGEEEIGSPTLPALLAEYAGRLEADVVIALDSLNADVGSPSVTTSLRGLLNVILTVRTSDRAAHSGVFGGVVPDAVGALVQVLASLADSDGDAAIAGLSHGTGAGAPPSVDSLRAASGLLDGVAVLGTGSLAERLWYRPAVTVTGIGAPEPHGAANALAPTANASISLRLAPEEDPRRALELLLAHVEAHVPWGSHATVDVVSMGRGWRADADAATMRAASASLARAFGRPAAEIGVGGGIPFIASYLEAFPGAEAVITAIQDPQSRAHAADESVSIDALFAATRAQIDLVRTLGRAHSSIRTG